MTDTKDKKIVIVGYGKMGMALLNSIISEKGYSLLAVDPDKKQRDRAESRGAAAFPSVSVAPAGEIYIIAVKPQEIDSVLNEIRNKELKNCVVVSIAAGISLFRLKSRLPEVPVVRAMPNTPLVAGEGMTAISLPENITDKVQKEIKKLFSFSGKIEIVEEKLMDAATAVSGSGPAYLFYLAEEMRGFLIEKGMKAKQADKFVSQTVLGAGKLMADSPESFKQLRKNVTSPGGTTEAALKYMKKKKFRGIFSRALKSAFERSVELSGEGG